MARERHAGESDSAGSSSSPSKRVVEPESLPGGCSSGAQRRVGARRRYTPGERAELLLALECSGQSVERFAAEHGVSPATLHMWRYRVRHEGKRPPNRSSHQRTFSPEQRRAAVEGWAKSGMTAFAFAKLFGVSSESLRAWRRAYEVGGPKALEPKKRGRPKGDGRSQLPGPVQAEIVRTKRRFPTFGLKKVRDFLKRFQGKSVSTGSVRKVLASEGLHPGPEKKSRRKRREIIRRFERSKPGELWQTDITSYVLTRSGVRVYLTVFLDDFSRYVVSWQLATHQKSELVCEALMEGIERFGKPEEVLSDQGRQYFAWRGKSDFQRLLAREGIRHVVARTHHPETLGKCERLWETIWTELWERASPQDLGEARERLAHYFAHYNHLRPHQGIGGLVPADRFFKAEDALRATLETRLEKDELGTALAQTPRKSVYVFGQVGDQQVSLHGERGRIVLVTSDGVQKELALEDLGLPQKEKDNERGDNDRDERDDARAAHAAREEAAGLSATAPGAELGADALGVGEQRGEGARAPDVRGAAVDVARAQDESAGGERARAAAASSVAVEPGGGVWDARGPLEATQGQRQGDPPDAVRGGPARAEEADQRARSGEQDAEGAARAPAEPPGGDGAEGCALGLEETEDDQWQESDGTAQT